MDKSKFEKINLPLFGQKVVEDITKFYLSNQKTHKLNWVYGYNTVEIKFNYLKKLYQSTSTLAQYCILRILEDVDLRKEEISVEMLSAKIGYPVEMVIHELNGFIFNPSFNPKRILTSGVILTNIKEGSDINSQSIIRLNHDFIANSLKINTIPLILKVSIVYLYKLYDFNYDYDYIITIYYVL